MDFFTKTLAKGCFGKVYKQKYGDAWAAVKKVPTNFITNEQLSRECHVYEKAQHINVVRLLGKPWLEDGKWHIPLEFVFGEDLETAIFNVQKSTMQLIPSVKATIITGMCEGLNFLHSKDIVHQDLKPDNIMIEHGSHRAVIIDMGLAKFFKNGFSSADNLGNEAYAAPEIFQNNIRDKRSDVWAMGKIVAELCARVRLPTRGVTPVKIKDTLKDNLYCSAVCRMVLENPAERSSMFGIIGEIRQIGARHGVNQGVNQGMNQWLNQGANQGVHQGMNQGVNQGVHQGMNQGANQGVHQGMNQGAHQGMNQGATQGVHQGMNQGVHQGMNQGVHQVMNQGATQGVHQGMNQGVHQGMNQGANQGVHQVMNQGANQWVNQGATQRVNQGANQWVNQGVNQGANQWVNQGVNQGAGAGRPPTGLGGHVCPKVIGAADLGAKQKWRPPTPFPPEAKHQELPVERINRCPSPRPQPVVPATLVTELPQPSIPCPLLHDGKVVHRRIDYDAGQMEIKQIVTRNGKVVKYEDLKISK